MNASEKVTDHVFGVKLFKNRENIKRSCASVLNYSLDIQQPAEVAYEACF